MDWIYSPDDPLLQVLGGCLLMFLAIIIITRLVGLRSFAKFTTYDFAITVAIGSIISSTLTSSTSIAHGATAIAGLLSLTYFGAWLQRKSEAVDTVISNRPLLLMKGSEILHENLKRAKVQESELIAKLREANVISFDQVVAVVLETTGDVSVLHRAVTDSNELDKRILETVES